MKKELLRHCFRRLRRSKLAIALPATFLILFVSTLGIVAFTYYFSVERINTQGQTLKVSTAKTNLLSLSDAITSTLWQPGASSTYKLTDSGGTIHIEPTSNPLSISISGGDINEAVFNASVGKVVYELPYQSSSETGLYLKGDQRSITNQSGASVCQLCIENGEEHPEVQLRYRPAVTAASSGTEDGKAANTVRIYIVNLNSSDAMALLGTVPLQATCQGTELTTKTYTASAALTSLTVTAVLDGTVGRVVVPISSTGEGSVIHLELVVCNLCVERWLM